MAPLSERMDENTESGPTLTGNDETPAGPGGKPPDSGRTDDSVSKGVGLTLLMHLLGQALFTLATLGPSILFFGVSQLLYVVPAYVIAIRKGYPQTARGIAITAGISFLLNAGCTALVLGTIYVAL